MSTKIDKHSDREERRDRFVGGVALIIIGLIALFSQIGQFDEWGLLVLPALSIIFLAWGLLTRGSGLLIPGGILGGIGLGVLLITGPFARLDGDAEGGIFMLAFALGWLLIPILSTIFTKERHLWALIPASIMGTIGGGLLFGGVFFSALEFLGLVWPVLLILAGLFLLLRRRSPA